MSRVRVNLRIIGERIKELRENKDKDDRYHAMNQQEFADRFGVSLETVRNWEQGYNYPSPDTLVDIAQYYKVPIDYMYGRTTLKKALNFFSEKALETIENIARSPYDDRQIISDFFERHDIIQKMIEYASLNYGIISEWGSAKDPSFNNRNFDYVITPDTLHFLAANSIKDIIMDFLKEEHFKLCPNDHVSMKAIIGRERQVFEWSKSQKSP